MSSRKLNIPSLGFDVVVIGASKKTNDVIADLLEKKIATEEVDSSIVWGKDEGYCAWCVDNRSDDSYWEHAMDSQGEYVRYACCKKCAVDRGVEASK